MEGTQILVKICKWIIIAVSSTAIFCLAKEGPDSSLNFAYSVFLFVQLTPTYPSRKKKKINKLLSEQLHARLSVGKSTFKSHSPSLFIFEALNAIHHK